MRGRAGHRNLRPGRWIAIATLVAVAAGCGGGQGSHAGPTATATLTPVQAATWGAYVALGDSYSSGEGDGAFLAGSDTAKDQCHRSAHAYPPAVARDYHFAGGTAFWACSGATTHSMEHGQCFTPSSGGKQTKRYCEPAQVGRVTAKTSLVTFSIGGNDMGFVPVLTTCVLGGTKRCTAQQASIDAKRGKLRTDLRQVVMDVHKRAPYARIVVLGYPRLFPAQPAKTADLLSAASQRWLNKMAGQLDSTIKQTVQGADAVIAKSGHGSAEYVDPRAAVDGHEVGTADPYINGLELHGLTAEPGSFHPDAKGQGAFAAVVDGRISASPGRPLVGPPST